MQYLSQQQDPTTGKPIIDQKALQAYMNHSQQQRAYVAGGMTAGMSLVQALQHGGYAGRETLARTNLYQAQAEEARQTNTTPAVNQVWDPSAGRYVSVLQHGKSAQVLHQQAGTPGSVQYDPTGKAVGFYDNNGGYHPYAAQGTDLSALFGGAGNPAQPGATPPPAAGAGGGATTTGPQPTDQAYATQGDPGNLPPIYRQQPAGQPAAGAQAQAAQVHVMHPDGKTDGYIPASQLQAALQLGYRQL
jgi:hypothetical protein